MVGDYTVSILCQGHIEFPVAFQRVSANSYRREHFVMLVTYEVGEYGPRSFRWSEVTLPTYCIYETDSFYLPDFKFSAVSLRRMILRLVQYEVLSNMSTFKSFN